MKPKERHVWLSWKILECKLMYYRPELVHESWHKTLATPDAQYDAYEAEYLKLCTKLKLEPTAQQMVGFDTNRSSCRLVLEKHAIPKK